MNPSKSNAKAEDIDFDEGAPPANGDSLVGDELAQRYLKKRDEREVDRYFRALVKLEGSDLHMKVGRPPMVRIHPEAYPCRAGGGSPRERRRDLFRRRSEPVRQSLSPRGAGRGAGVRSRHSCA